MFAFEKLNVYSDALQFVDHVYDVTNHWPKIEMFSLIDQIRRAAISIVLNIAEGSSRTKKDFAHFLGLARGSCYECVAILTIAKNRKYIDEKIYKIFYDECTQLSRMISGLKQSVYKP